MWAYARARVYWKNLRRQVLIARRRIVARLGVREKGEKKVMIKAWNRKRAAIFKVRLTIF